MRDIKHSCPHIETIKRIVSQDKPLTKDQRKDIINLLEEIRTINLELRMRL